MNSHKLKSFVKRTAKKYEEVKEYFCRDVEFSKKDELDKVEEEIFKDGEVASRVWLLFASHNGTDWECLQVGQSKDDVKNEINRVLVELIGNIKRNTEVNKFTNSAFYENVRPEYEKKEYPILLYNKIGKEYEHFRICFLDVDRYLGIESKNSRENDIERIVYICKNQYAEAKIAYQTLALYWKQYNSNVDGQTICYIAEGHQSEFE